tara:strand:- start:1007 stop:2260 length:1254 start_codon:yes stop_codon:yes gene_type:complete
MSIPFFSLDLNSSEILKVFQSVILPFNKHNSKKKLTQILEERFKNKNISLLPSARIGFYLTLKNLFKEGDELIFSSMSFPLYVKIANQLNLKVRLVDVNIEDLNINYELIEQNINSNTKGIVATHLFGNPCEIDKIKKICEKYKLKLIEDCAQSFDSFHKGIETGNFGDVAIFSTSLLKIPTTLSGGILVTNNVDLNYKVDSWIEKNLNKANIIYDVKLLIKVFLSILNSIPWIYSIISDKIFKTLNNHNPRIYRKILYSGMGMEEIVYNPLERNDLKKYQIEIGIKQIKKNKRMTEKRISHSHFLNKGLFDEQNIRLINCNSNSKGNYQYYVIEVKKNAKNFFNNIFKNGIHVMEEDVWDCTNYGFKIENPNDNFEQTKKSNPNLIRIQNNSYLNKKLINKILLEIKKNLNETGKF